MSSSDVAGPDVGLGGPPQVGDPLDRAATLASVRRKLLDVDTDERPALSRHVLLRRIGSGGYGLVFEAYDPELDRKVAVKLLKRSTRSEEQRSVELRAEAQNAARISHPNVIAIYDVGCYAESDLRLLTATREVGELPTSGVFVVMEFVGGPNLSDWAAARRQDADWRGMLGVLRQAGEGLAAAHAHGVIHRDFKPSNVLVGEGTLPRVRVVDFGLAMPAHTRPSGPGDLCAGIVGTPSYIAPEIWQGEAPSESSDQFSFCTAAWEILAGERPFSHPVRDPAKAAAWFGALAPPRTSRVPARVWRALRRGLHPDSARRHGSMDALLRELQEPTSTGRRITVSVAAVAGVAGLTALALGPSDPCEEPAERLDSLWTTQTRQALRARVEQARSVGADEAWQTAAAALDEHASQWAHQALEVCAAQRTTSGGEERKVLTRRSACLEQRALEFERTLDVLMHEDPSVAARVVAVVEGLQPVSDCSDPQRDGPSLPPPGLERAEAMQVLAELERARALWVAGQQSRRAAVAASALQRASRLGHEPTEARALIAVAESDWDAERLEPAMEGFRAALLLAERAGDEAIAVEAMVKIGAMLGKPLHRWGEAGRMLDWAQARNHDPLLDLKIRRYRGIFAVERGEFDEAIVILRGALSDAETTMGPQALFLSSLLVPLGNAYSAVDQSRASVGAYRRALELRHRALGPSDGDAMLVNNLGVAFDGLGETGEACDHYERALEMFERTYGPVHGTVGMALNNVGGCLSRRSQNEAALDVHRRALDVKQQALADCRVDCGYSRVNLGDVLLELQRPEEALVQHQEGLSSWIAGFGSQHPRLSVPRAGIAEALLDMGRREEARPYIDRGLAVLKGTELPEVRLRLLFLRTRARPPEERNEAIEDARRLVGRALLPRDAELVDKMKAWLRTASKTAQP